VACATGLAGSWLENDRHPNGRVSLVDAKKFPSAEDEDRMWT
jgi:hypothetical protein